MPIDTDSKIPNFKAVTATAYGSGCIGCKDTKSNVMLSFGEPTPYGGQNSPIGEREPLRVVDVFLDRAAAKVLWERLGEVLRS